MTVLSQRAENELRAAFRALGAVTPANARPGKEFPVVDAAIFDNLLRRGVIREGAPGTFYLYEPPPNPHRWFPRVLFWIAVIALPVGIIQFCPGSP
jgi:hypothetical protein